MNRQPPNQTDETATQPSSTSERLPQHSYLLRLWRSGVDGSWRASLQVVQTGERHMFADLGSLLAFLIEQARPPPAG